MATTRATGSKPRETPSKKHRPATTPEGRENQLVALAVDLVEKQMREGTASSQVITHYLKLGSSREQLEQEKLRRENELLRAKVEDLAQGKRIEDLLQDAVKAMSSYQGRDPVEEDRFDD